MTHRQKASEAEPLTQPICERVIVIVGPTASGKSDLAVELAREFDGEVISADSRQVYRGMDIGTGKITTREMRGVKHHLLDVCSPRRVFTAHDFIVRGRKAITDISERGKIPIIAGGTGFYIDALVGCVNLPDIPADDALRAKLEKKSPAQLFALLKKRDPRRAADILKKGEQSGELTNSRRLIRALEISYSNHSNQVAILSNRVAQYEVLWVGIAADDKVARKKIHKRLLARIKQGMVAEVKRLHEKRVSWKRMESLGLEYRYVARYVTGKLTKDEMLEQLENKIWQYARRQKSYWRRNKNIHWFKPTKTDYKKIEGLVRRFLNS